MPSPEVDSPESEPSKLRTRLRNELRDAWAAAHDVPAGHLSLNDLIPLVIEHGLPPRAEREAMVAARKAGE